MKYFFLGIQTLKRTDRVLLAALAMACLFCFLGITWGGVECWNRDAMAMRGLHGLVLAGNYGKPPVFTYVGNFLVKYPLSVGEWVARLICGPLVSWDPAKLLGCRLITLGMFLGMIVLSFRISREFFGLFAARAAALAVASCAGFVAYAHFLSCDLPLLFAMLVAFYFATRVYQRGLVRDYLWAGFTTAVATNTKYNGLAVGIAFVVAHLLAKNTWKERLWSPALWKGLLMVPVGLVLTDPGMVIEPLRFWSDFRYNYVVTPSYGGQMNGHGYGLFLARFTEIIGWPGFLFLAFAVTFSCLKCAWLRRLKDPQVAGFLMLSSVALLYYAKIGGFPRVETRFCLPAAFFALLMAGPFWKSLEGSPWRWLFFVPGGAILVYNGACSYYVGKRFNEDPRMPTLRWMQAHSREFQRIESSAGCPRWRHLPGVWMSELEVGKPPPRKPPLAGQTIDLRLPNDNNRVQLFKAIFKNDPWVAAQSAKYEGCADASIFTEEQLLKRAPQLVCIYSSDIVNGADAYYRALLNGQFPYHVIYDRSTPPSPWWVYPKNIDFLDGRMALLLPNAH